MPIAVSVVVSEVRRFISDKDLGESQRYKDADILGALRMAVADMRRMRPDVFFLDLSATPDPTKLSELPIEDWLLSPTVMLTTGYLLMQNDQFSSTGLAAGLVTSGKRALREPE